jgi:hypothetical protein
LTSVPALSTRGDAVDSRGPRASGGTLEGAFKSWISLLGFNCQ